MHSLENHVIPALQPRAFGRQAAKGGIQMAPRLRGGDEGLTLISMGGATRACGITLPMLSFRSVSRRRGISL
jgi:hypothetical protein